MAPSTFKPSSIVFEIPKRTVIDDQVRLSAFQSYISTKDKTNTVREQSHFINPIILNDSNALLKFQYNQIPNTDITCSSSTTIDDADSMLLSSSSTLLSYQQRKHDSLYNSLPILPTSLNADTRKRMTKIYKHQVSNDDSGPELDQISDLTSKIFSSGDEENVLIVDNSVSMSSSITIPSYTEKIVYI